jgi:Zn-finger nucleic acid-binding protein
MVYRENLPSCPRCGDVFKKIAVGRLRFDRCAACASAWVETSTLESMWRSMGGDRLLLAGRSSDLDPVACPRCRRPMAPRAILAVPVDHCADHGVWFDAEELGTALAGAAMDEETWMQTFADALRAMR